MKLEYLNGVRITKLPHEMSPLESAISRYEELAKKHYDKASAASDLPEDKRQAALNASLQHLERERALLSTIFDVQAELDVYREQGLGATKGTEKERTAALNMMRAEAHHPTELLERYMRAEGTPKPSPQHTAHHIVPGKGKLPRVTSRTRFHLHIHGIRINDPANGVYLVAKDKDTPHWSMPKSTGHLTYHTIQYEQWVNQAVVHLSNIDFIKTKLQIVGRLLQNNESKQAIPKLKQV